MATTGARRHLTVRIDEETFDVAPRETILQAALRSGVDLPSGCRAGGCGACKCRLDEGRVRERTETGYLLGADEIARGYILACQSVPTSDVRITVDRRGLARRVPGRVVAQERVTHDITRLRVALDAPLAYRAGQFANVSVEGLAPGGRSYSFATAPRANGEVAFLVRKVPGGVFSSLVNDAPLVGRAVDVAGPHGDFWLQPRAGDAPILFVAGGSGLAPILAMLEEAIAAGVRRSVTVLFGARTEKDLYARDVMAATEKAWPGRFRFVPVLSDATDDATWTGARGLVTDHIEEVLEGGADAYLCGPPAMVDAGVATLGALGVGPERIRHDRFVTGPGPAVATPQPVSAWVAVLHYAKFGLFHLVGLAAAVAILAGGHRTTAGLVAILAVYIVGDAVLGDDTSTPELRRPGLLTAQLWLALPLVAVVVLAAVWSVATGDPLGAGARLSAWTGYDLLAARAATTTGAHVATWILTGLMIGLVGTIPAHELTHRTWDRVSLALGRWLLAFSFDTSFAIEHVYGHHRYVATRHDPATAPRGRNVYHHIVASTVAGNASAWRIEAARLGKRGRRLLSPRNAVLRGYAMSLVLVGLASAVGGLRGAAFFVACGAWGKALLEIVNYMEHYGLVRSPATPVAPRHSWNTNRRVSSWTMFNLTRHSHHHAEGERPYHELAPYPGAPQMLGGYLTTLVVAMIPPLWHALMTPRVRAWDADHATDEERALAIHAGAGPRRGTGPSIHLPTAER